MQDPTLLGTENDLVFSCPPFDARATAGASEGKDEDQLAGLLLIRGAQTLASGGEALFVLTPACWSNVKERGWRSKLADAGLAVGAHFSIPSGAFAPFTNIPTVLVQVVRGTQSDIFVGEIPESVEQGRTLLENFRKHRDARDARLGRWVPLDGFTSLPRFLAQERLEHLGRRAGKRVRLADIASVRTWNPDAEAQGSTVLLPVEGSASRQAVLEGTGDPPKGRHLALQIHPGAAVPEYVVHYFNSELGRATRDAASAGATFARLSEEALCEAPIYLPDLHTQQATVATSNKIQTLVNELRELEESLWTRPTRHAQIRKTLRESQPRRSIRTVA
ncbi:MAG: hypothetical protein U0353_27430 [Sandaracinus sp.]